MPEPVKVAPASHSRDDSEVVSGAIGNWVSSLAATVRVRPSGVWAIPGTSDATTPVSGGGRGCRCRYGVGRHRRNAGVGGRVSQRQRG